MQPPSGGCVLKLALVYLWRVGGLAATFGWLCVETVQQQEGELLRVGSHLRVAVC